MIITDVNNGELETLNFCCCMYYVCCYIYSWCKPCQKLYPTLCELAKTNESKFGRFLKVNVDTCDEIAIECSASILPTYQIYLNGKKVASLTGAKEDKLKDLFAKDFK